MDKPFNLSETKLLPVTVRGFQHNVFVLNGNDSTSGKF